MSDMKLMNSMVGLMREADHVIGPNGLLATKARVVVTNSIHFLKHFDHICYVRRGVILESGTYVDLITNPQRELHKLVYVFSIPVGQRFADCSMPSKGHGNLNASLTSGSSTPFMTGDSTTPASSEGDNKTAVEQSTNELTEEKLDVVDKTLIRRKSYAKAVIDDSFPTSSVSDGPTKEHSEQGRVKREVYLRYIEAASKAGFISFVVALLVQQIANFLGNNMLRHWGNHNTQVNGNEGAGWYLLGYSLFSLSSVLLGALASILIWVLCSVRSSRRLHDAVSVLAARTECG